MVIIHFKTLGPTRIEGKNMMKQYFYAVLMLGSLVFTSCGGDSSNKASEIVREHMQSHAMVTCPMCGGSGEFYLMPGDVMSPKQTCTGCGGSGECDSETAQAILEMQAQAASAGVPTGAGVGGTGHGRSADQIRYELQKAYELLEDMKRDYAMTESAVSRSQYPPMIAEMEQRIRALEAEMRAAQ